jgi:uncharacterized protein YfaS (alpha-2-macroglobulin family)
VRPASPKVTLGGALIATTTQPATLRPPTGILPGSGEFTLRVAPRPQLQLPEGLDYLTNYPYGCCEQIASSAMPLVYLRDIGDLIAPGIFDPRHVDDAVDFALRRLALLQTADGGLAMWPEIRHSWPWGTVHAAHFIVLADAAGHRVPPAFMQRLIDYLRTQLTSGTDTPYDLELQAYACYVLALARHPDRAAMNRLADVLDRAAVPGVPGPTPQTRFHLAAAWLAGGNRDRAASLVPAVLPQPRTGRDRGPNVGSDVRDRAVILSTLLSVAPDRPEIPAMAEQLADLGRRGQWRSTQDVAMSIMALGQYLRLTRDQKAYDGVELWRGGEKLASADHGKPLVWNSAAVTDALEVRVSGPENARGYVTWGQSGVPLEPLPDAQNQGLQVHRRYLDRDGNPNSGGKLASGQLVWVELTVQGSAALGGSASPQGAVIIEDMLPAGLEIENPRLATTARGKIEEPDDTEDETEDAGLAVAPAKPRRFVPYRMEVRDDRLVLWGNAPVASPGRFVYLARAVTAGEFAVPPVRAESMYDIAVHAIGGGGARMVVLPPDSGKARLAGEAE